MTSPLAGYDPSRHGDGSKAGQASGTGRQRKRSSGMLAICSGDESGEDSEAEPSPKSPKRTVKVKGSEAFRVRRHKSDGTVSSSRGRNKFITVGSIKNIHLKSLEDVYDPSGNKGYCLSSLCSLIVQGESRLAVCDCKGGCQGKLPKRSGTHDTANWKKVQKLSAEAMKRLRSGK